MCSRYDVIASRTLSQRGYFTTELSCVELNAADADYQLVLTGFNWIYLDCQRSHKSRWPQDKHAIVLSMFLYFTFYDNIVISVVIF